MWNSLEIIKLVSSLVTPIVIVILGYYFNRRLKKSDQKNATIRLHNKIADEQKRDKLESRYNFRIEFTLATIFYGPQKDFYLAEFIATINNKSLVKKSITTIALRIRGIQKNEDILLWVAKKKNTETGSVLSKQTSRINFPITIVKENILPPFWKNIFVEPGVKQDITFVTRIPANISYVLATASFYYDNIPEPHTAERMFELKETTA